MKRALLVAAVLLAGCAGHKAKPSGILVLRVSPAEARVMLDDRYVGTAAQLSGRPLRLSAGVRRLEVNAEGNYPARREADIRPGAPVELRIELHPIPDGERDVP